MEIDFNGLRTKLSIHSPATIKHIKKILDKGILFEGLYTKKFIASLSKFFPGRYILPTASGHDALVLALHSLRLQPGDEVIVPTNSYPTYFPVALSGAQPVPVDVTIDGLIDPDQVTKKLTKRTRAVIITHLYGLIANVKKIKQLIKDTSVVIIEDCAQSFGSQLGATNTGMFGDMGAFSLYPTKNLSTIGDGGFLVIKQKSVFEWCKMTATYGEKNRYQSIFPSFHSRLGEVNASFALEMLKKVKETKKLNKFISNYYQETILKHNTENNVYILKGVDDSNIMRHLFVISVRNRDRLKQYLAKRGIGTHIHYPTSIHQLPAFTTFFRSRLNNYPNADLLTSTILSLPFHPYMTRAQIQYISKSISNFYD